MGYFKKKGGGGQDTISLEKNLLGNFREGEGGGGKNDTKGVNASRSYI